MKRLILIITILILSSCQWIYDRGEDIVFPEIPHMGFKTIQEVMAYTSQIMYVSDNIHDCDEYWQSPIKPISGNAATARIIPFSPCIFYIMSSD